MTRKAVGWTLMEILTVFLIVALFLGLLFPILSSARERARMAACISNLRQVHVAWRSYVDDYGAYPSHIAQLLKHPNKGVFLCPSDGWSGLNVGAQHRSGMPVSYFYAGFELTDGKKRHVLEQVDPNHGIMFCILHTRYKKAHFDRTYQKCQHQPETCANSTNPYPPVRGTLLRLRIDGSVQHAQIQPHCYQLPICPSDPKAKFGVGSS